MAYTDFTLETAEATLGVPSQPGDLFPSLSPIPVPAWLQESLARGMALALLSEKARSEFVVAPILLAARELSRDAIAIYSGQRLDVDASRGLLGECDFILALSPPVPRLRTPLVTIVEAKEHDIEAGLGQCIAQMVAARLFSERAGQHLPALFGCVTTGEAWQFLRLEGDAVILDRTRLYIDAVGLILAALRAILAQEGVPV
jgi:hypothetical protein